jgi:hypothetical protein
MDPMERNLNCSVLTWLQWEATCNAVYLHDNSVRQPEQQCTYMAALGRTLNCSVPTWIKWEVRTAVYLHEYNVKQSELQFTYMAKM